MFVLEQVGRALLLSFSMFWEVLWPLALGFLLSAIVQSVVSKQAVLGWRILTTGGREMLRMMSAPPQRHAMEGGHGHHH